MLAVIALYYGLFMTYAYSVPSHYLKQFDLIEQLWRKFSVTGIWSETFFIARMTLKMTLGILVLSTGPIWQIKLEVLIFVWRKHEDMSQCTGSKVNTSNEWIASCAGSQFSMRASVSRQLLCPNHLAMTHSQKRIVTKHMGSLLLTWINFNPSMAK